MAETVAGDSLAATEEFTILVAVSNPSSARQLARTAVDVARANDGNIHVVSVIHKPYTSPFLMFSDDHIKAEYSDGREKIVDQARSVADESDVPVSDSLLVGSDVADAITSAIDRIDADAVLLGWRGESRTSDVVLGTTIDPVLAGADCDVLVEKVGTEVETVDSILLPTVGGPHAKLAADVSSAIAVANDASIGVLSVVSPDATDRERAQADRHVAKTMESFDDEVTATPLVRDATDVADEIMWAASDHDLIVLGATRKGLLGRKMVGAVPKTVGERADCPVIVTKRRSDDSWFGRLLARLWS